jgi:hypothetical protein
MYILSGIFRRWEVREHNTLFKVNGRLRFSARYEMKDFKSSFLSLQLSLSYAFILHHMLSHIQAHVLHDPGGNCPGLVLHGAITDE